MKTVLLIRHLFQLLAFISIYGVIGSLGAWEMGSIHIVQLLVQLLFFTGCGWFSAVLSRRRFYLRLRHLAVFARHRSAPIRPSYAATHL